VGDVGPLRPGAGETRSDRHRRFPESPNLLAFLNLFLEYRDVKVDIEGLLQKTEAHVVDRYGLPERTPESEDEPGEGKNPAPERNDPDASA